MLNVKLAAKGYASIGSESRLALLLLLVQAGSSGMTISEIGSELKMPPSTLAHHLKQLVTAGMVIQEKQGREVMNTAHFDNLEELGNFLLLECCKNEKLI
ncbi:winged helix-turn-helix domain-containing protein [Desulfogranum marinum]|uniref:ArsR/SmtB family transcription factor n=1 Tax=Desulfogranum marinum TaxID=453220 RepID=UPI0029C7F091|nr:winged helix-turn-helix domain-containing protein [Desulfogranum marinum]